MDSSKEKIEAQLCAYVDGLLDDTERAEIERHLAANPQHKALITELRQASDLLKGLPRAKVPGDLNEGLNGQLERSVLLGPSSDEESGGGVLVIHRWPQITAVAAVLLLAVGLGIVVYYVLPPAGGNRNNTVAVDEQALKTARPQTDGRADRDADTFRAKPGEPMTRPAPANPEKEIVEGLEGRGKFGSTEWRDSGGSNDRKLAVADPNADRSKDYAYHRSRGMQEDGVVTAKEVNELQKIRQSFGLQNQAFNLDGTNSLFMVVSTNNPDAANAQVAMFFRTNGIEYQTGEAGAADATLDRSRAMALHDSYGDSLSKKSAGGDRDQPAKAEALKAPVSGAQYGVALAPAAAATSDPANLESATTAVRGQKMAAKPSTPAGGEPKKPTGATSELQAEADTLAATPPGTAAKQYNDAATPNFSLGEKNKTRMAEQKTKDDVAVRGPDMGKAVAKGGAGGGGGTASGLDQPTNKRDANGDGSSWAMRGALAEQRVERFAEDGVRGRNSSIVARMSRRQANELTAALSREQGQRAELLGIPVAASSTAGQMPESADKVSVNGITARLGTDAAPSLPTVQTPASTLGDSTAPQGASRFVTTKPATTDLYAGRAVGGWAEPQNAPTAGSRAGGAGAGAADGGAKQEQPSLRRSNDSRAWQAATGNTNGADAMRLSADPMDEPVDVVIVLRDAAAATAPPATSAPAK